MTYDPNQTPGGGTPDPNAPAAPADAPATDQPVVAPNAGGGMPPAAPTEAPAEGGDQGGGDNTGGNPGGAPAA